MPEAFFAIGTSLSNLKNVEDWLDAAPHVLPDGYIPLAPPNARRTLAQNVVRNGSTSVPMRWDALAHDKLRTFIRQYWGDYSAASAVLFTTWLDEQGYYSPFRVVVERPYANQHYRVNNPLWVVDVAIPAHDWTLQSITVTSSQTLTTSQRLVYANTGGGSITLTLPAASAPNANTVFSVVKTAAANTLTVQASGSDTINGSASVSLTALNARLDVYSNGVAAWTSVTYA